MTTYGAQRVTNPGYETNLNGWAQHAGGTTTITRDTTEFHGGVASAKMVTGGTVSEQGIWESGNTTPIANGETVEVAVWVKGSGSLRLMAKVRNAAGSHLATYQSDAFTAAGTWTRYAFTFQSVEATAAWVRPVIGTASAQAVTFYADDWEVRQVFPSTSTTVLSLGSSRIGPLRVG